MNDSEGSMGRKILGIIFNAVVSVLTFAILFVAATLFFPVPIPAGLEMPYKVGGGYYYVRRGVCLHRRF
jgi:hypothetical protein